MIIMEDLEELKYDFLVEFIFARSSHDRAIVHVVFEISRVLVVQRDEDVIHKALHISRGVGWAKGHDFWGIKSPCCLKGKYIF